MDIEFVHNIPT